MRVVGIDFDNTIVCYEGVFTKAALKLGLIPANLPPGKQQVRDYLRRCGREEAWTELQGYVYGPGMEEALPFAGIFGFLEACRQVGIQTCIISHRTRHPYAGPLYDLHRAAVRWLECHGFFELGFLGAEGGRIFFELTKHDKLRRIEKVGCTHFIDDLPELLTEENFPAAVERILFDPNGRSPVDPRFRRVSSWKTMARLLAGEGSR